MFNKFYFKYTLFVIILFLIALIIDAKTQVVNLPVITGEEFEEQVVAMKEDDYLIYVSDFNDFIFPINIVANKSNNFKMSYYNNNVDTKIDEKIFMTFSLLTNYSNYLPNGVKTTIPPSTQLLSYEINEGILTLNMSKEFLNYKEINEKNMIKILTYTFTELPNVEGVNLMCEGESIEFKTTLEEVFSQSDFALNVYLNTPNIQDTNPYLIYYYTEANDNMYLVPVTVYDSYEKNLEKIITNTYKMPVVSLINQYELTENNTEVFFENELSYYQYYFTFYENNKIVNRTDLDIKDVNFYEIKLVNE